MRAIGPLVAALVAVLLVVSGTLFTIDQRFNAIVFQLGEIKSVVSAPGLHFKWPLLQNVRQFDMRILSYDDPEPLRFITSEKKPGLVDSFVMWRIKDVKQFYISVRGDEFAATTRIRQTISDSLQAEFGRRTVHDVVSGQRDEIMGLVRDKVDQELRRIGVEIVDVRLKRVDLPQEVSESVYRRMESERKRVANELRSTGAAEAERIRADADRQREVTIANAYRDAQKIKGEGDAQAAATYNDAFGRDPQFARFYRSLDAYKATFNKKADVMVLDPSGNDFFRVFRGVDAPAAAARGKK